MSDLIQSLFLSPVLIFMVMGVLLLFVTAWAFRLREYPGYMLGWLMGIFFIIIYLSLAGARPATATDAASSIANPTLSFFQVLMPAVLGILLGTGLLYSLGRFIDSHVRRSIGIAFLTATLVVILFFLVAVTGAASRMISIFAMAFAIGVLAVIVISGTPRRQRGGPPGTGGPGVPGGRIPEARLDEARSRFDNVRRRMQRPYD